ncbi:MAG TPA: lysophospholipid acyltransferase family protein [Deltaproteobacteria bacterium]|nr:1-acyl-sn-glycerol-3-phosphate acyltransferase [Deltaproteobacteria bacterium]NLW68490.1 1-acyl-sn-glycerol-3-phosphate acyltransferase [Bacteriovoracaceae bacterium]HRR20335.1 lysophospholipid acyltransferase family protein [Desulfomonilia bacterium]HOD70690.1 lysophospholipid acyltransferase family protein [Deltaproteobacteria bacterium]HOE73399.1 lysophospholipid acyltransferase family protein [Deltaproteobacteria bacterium]
MRASFLRKFWIMAQGVAITLGISVLGLYMRFTGTYERTFADRILRWWSRSLLKSPGVRVHVSNPHNTTVIPGTPCIIMSNHRSHYDIPLIFTSLPGSIRMLTKKELFKVPIWGRGLKAAEFLSIDRHDHAQAIKDLEYAKEQMKSGIVLWIAPEGTRSRTGALGEFKKGGFMVAIQTGATIIPVGIRDSEKILKPGTWDFCLNQDVHITIGRPFDASTYTLETRDRLMEDVRRSIQELAQ